MSVVCSSDLWSFRYIDIPPRGDLLDNVHAFRIFPSLTPVSLPVDYGTLSFPEQHEATVFSVVEHRANRVPRDVFRCDHAKSPRMPAAREFIHAALLQQRH